MVLRHAADPRAGVGDAHAVHEERGAPAARARGRGLGRLLRRRVRRGRGVLARDALLHDFDYEIHPTLDKHPQDGAPILREEGYPEELIEAVLSHAEHLAMPRDTQLKKVLFACDELSGFVHACGLVRPTGLDGLEPKSVKKKLKQPSFAAGVHRDEVYAGAELLGLELDEHIANVVAAMQPIARRARAPNRRGRRLGRSARGTRGRGSRRPRSRRRTPRTCGRRSCAARRGRRRPRARRPAASSASSNASRVLDRDPGVVAALEREDRRGHLGGALRSGRVSRRARRRAGRRSRSRRRARARLRRRATSSGRRSRSRR